MNIYKNKVQSKPKAAVFAVILLAIVYCHNPAASARFILSGEQKLPAFKLAAKTRLKNGYVSVQVRNDDVTHREGPDETTADLLRKADIVAYRTRLVKTREKAENDELPDVLMFGDEHGKSDLLEKILQTVLEAEKAGRRLSVIGHGDVFDRGRKNLRNWEILVELKEIESRNANISVDLVFGNHDILLIMAMLIEEESMKAEWLRMGGNTVLNELGKDAVRELALWMLNNFKLFHVDEWGYLHVHAGVPVNEDGKLLISKEQLELWQA